MSQALVQGFGLISGILIIRFLSVNEYALYTLANAMLGTMTVLADGGIANGVLAEGGKVWQDRKALGVVLATGFELRKKFATVSLLILVPILFYLLYHHGASILFTLLIILSLMIAFIAALSDTLLEMPSKLHQDIGRLQKNQIITNLVRLVMISSSVFFFPWTFIALLGNGIPRIWGNLRLRKITIDYADPTQVPDPEIRKRILFSVKRVLPGSIYYCISGQITIWLISIFGSSASLAQIGALGRLAMVLSIFTILFSTLVVPRFAKLKDDWRLLLGRFIQIHLLLFLISFFCVSIIYFFPDRILSILGKNYANLGREVVLMSISGCINMVIGITFSLSISRGKVLPPIITIIGNLVTQLVLIWMLDLSTTINVLWFSIINSLVAFFMIFGYFVYNILKNKEMVSL
jgi:O-antigen/teichoic acid export membrane protein